jgi:hypothetical protein
MRYIGEIFGAARFSSFSTQSASSGNQIGRCSPAAADPLQHLDSANAAGLMLVLASDIDEQLAVNARRSP